MDQIIYTLFMRVSNGFRFEDMQWKTIIAEGKKIGIKA